MVDLKQNADDIQQEIDWLREILKTRSAMNSKQPGKYNDVLDIPPPDLSNSRSAYTQFVKQHGLGTLERFLVIISSVPHIKPELLDMFMAKNSQTHQVYTEFGGKQGKSHNGFIPTGVTILFILSGCDLKKRFEYSKLFDQENILFKSQILKLGEVEPDEPFLNGALTISKESLDIITTGKQRKPTFSNEFPAQLLTTQMDWEDLVLPPTTSKQLAEIETWLQYKDQLMEDWGMGKILKPGYKALFYGPPGTGKTLTANLLGKKVGIDVYRIDLSKLVSKYIGETEKNLSKIFNRAENKNWILFFDEADALFGKRTSVSDAHDRYANQEVSYLLQRIEDYNGLVILASNLKNNLDDAFMRRFQTSIHFPIPRAEERRKIWEKSFPKAAKLESRINLQDLAKNYELAGGSIINVVQHSALIALKRGNGTIHLEDINEGVRREYYKAGRTM
jgi:hypothetical protein